MADLFTRCVSQVLARHAGVDVVSAETRLADLRIDSLDMVDVMMELEETFGACIADDDVAACVTVGDLARLVERRKRCDT